MPKHGLSYSGCGRKFSFLLFFNFVFTFPFCFLVLYGELIPLPGQFLKKRHSSLFCEIKYPPQTPPPPPHHLKSAPSNLL